MSYMDPDLLSANYWALEKIRHLSPSEKKEWFAKWWNEFKRKTRQK